MNQFTSVPVAAADFRPDDTFFAPRMEVIRKQMLPYQWAALNDLLPDTEPSYCINNFRIAAGLKEGVRLGMVFQDSDLYKWLEAVSFALMSGRDEALEGWVDEAIDLMEKAQQPDGYLNTYYQLVEPGRRFTNLQENHELYCAGHLIEAAVAHKIATGSDRLLNIAIRFADLIDQTFGPEEGKLKGYPGHEVIEMALVKLYRLTGEARYLRLAKYFIDQRGQSPLYFEEEARKHNHPLKWMDSFMKYQYYQAGKPVREQKVAEGHAVRAMYLYSGMADVARETEDEELWNACVRLWDDVTTRQMYVTGAIGQSEIGESFTYDYDLPNDTIYAETCAQLGLCFFAQRMLMKDLDSRYADVMERVLYNGALSGMSLDGTRFFYVNPLEVVPKACEEDDLLRHVKYVRQKWFPCSCCPPNLARTLESIAGYAYSTGERSLNVHLYIGGELKVDLGGQEAALKVTTEYPWSGAVKVDVMSDGDYALRLRKPGWCMKFCLKLNGAPVTPAVEKGYIILPGPWREGDYVEVDFDMPVQLVRANPRVRQDIGKLSVTRGPLVYCLEQVDNGEELHRLAIRPGTEFTASWEPDLLGGIVSLSCEGLRLAEDQDALYAPATSPLAAQPRTLKWIPYYAWTNRAPGEMRVWVLER
jgi:DUF1680 family protein